MKKAAFISFVIVFLSAIPAEAQFKKRPFIHQVLTSPAVREVFHFGVSQFLPQLPIPTLDRSNILVDASVQRNITAAKSNLNDADAIIQKLLEKNKVTTATGTGATVDKPIQK
jgi:hypothetical protein